MILLPMAAYMLGNAIAARFAFRFGSLTLLICGRVVAFVGATALMLWFLVGGVGVWASVGAPFAAPPRMTMPVPF